MAIEFLDPAEDAAAPQAAAEAIGVDRAARRRPALGRELTGPLSAGVLLAAAAALAVTAAFQNVYAVTAPGNDLTAESVDGWGRYRMALGLAPDGVHGIRFGVALTACAGALAVLALAAGAALVPAVRARVPARLATGAAVTAGCAAMALVGVCATVALQLQSVRDTYRALGRQGDAGVAAGEQVHAGGALWFALAAVVAAALAVLALVQTGEAFRQRDGILMA
jgi:hypothetical protein